MPRATAWFDPAASQCRVQRRRRHGLGGFWRSRSGSVAIESTMAVSGLVAALAVLMHVVTSLYESDYMDRAARAAARAVALVPDSYGNAGNLATIACNAIRRELVLDADFDCAFGWTLTIDTGLTPGDLLSGESPDPGDRTGDMVRVRIGWTQGADPTQPVQPDQAPDQVAVGVARTEPEPAGQS